jgi:peptidoglycan/xylan/chitin deacetylase (PgdA/CDA1 family)
VKDASGYVALTYDDGPDPAGTPALLDALRAAGARATFFNVGRRARAHPALVRAQRAAGMWIGNHSYTHPHLIQQSQSQIDSEISRTQQAIANAGGGTPKLFRPPYGDYNDSVVSTVRNCGMYTIQWNIDSLDWKDLEASAISERVLKRIEPGSIILFHNAAKNTPAALPSVIEGLIQQGYTMVPVSQLILRDNYTMDHTGRQIPGQS